ncbi:MAG: hypothetical protein PHS48_05895 [Bacteroidales bacterium]|nr:hypothetical protein [Bacteroidales bacterium]
MKRIILTFSGLLFVASLYVGINAFKNTNLANNLLLANIEALALDEGHSGRAICFIQSVEGNGEYLPCGECIMRPGMGLIKGGHCSW